MQDLYLYEAVLSTPHLAPSSGIPIYLQLRLKRREIPKWPDVCLSQASISQRLERMPVLFIREQVTVKPGHNGRVQNGMRRPRESRRNAIELRNENLALLLCFRSRKSCGLPTGTS